MINKKQRILKTLKDFGRLSSARISGICQMNYDAFNKESEKLCKEGLIIQFKETVATYWQISKEGLKEVDEE